MEQATSLQCKKDTLLLLLDVPSHSKYNIFINLKLKTYQRWKSTI